MISIVRMTMIICFFYSSLTLCTDKAALDIQPLSAQVECAQGKVALIERMLEVSGDVSSASVMPSLKELNQLISAIRNDPELAQLNPDFSLANVSSFSHKKYCDGSGCRCCPLECDCQECGCGQKLSLAHLCAYDLRSSNCNRLAHRQTRGSLYNSDGEMFETTIGEFTLCLPCTILLTLGTCACACCDCACKAECCPKIGCPLEDNISKADLKPYLQNLSGQLSKLQNNFSPPRQEMVDS
jgi:hypothetical protein